MDGDTNRYPFDRHQTTLGFLLTASGLPDRSPTPSSHAPTAPSIPNLAIDPAALEQDHVPISIDLTASIPGVKFSGQISRAQSHEVTGIDLSIRRADNVIGVTIVVMLTMMCLALSLLAMVLRATAVKGQSTLLPLSLSVSLIFGLPALRNSMEPGVPPVGVFGDYVSFTWAELIVAASTVVVVWTWIVKSGTRRLEVGTGVRSFSFLQGAGVTVTGVLVHPDGVLCTSDVRSCHLTFVFARIQPIAFDDTCQLLKPTVVIAL